jgi:hypothetical protein
MPSPYLNLISLPNSSTYNPTQYIIPTTRTKLNLPEDDECLTTKGEFRIYAIDDGDWWLDMRQALPNDWEVGKIEPADPWGAQEEEIGHLIRSGRVYKPPKLSGESSTSMRVMEEEEEENQRTEPEEDRVLKQLKKIQADISIWGLLMSSYEHRNSFFKTLGKAQVPINITPEELVGFIMTSKAIKPTIAFTDKDLPPEGLAHNKPLYISLKCLTKWIPLVLVDNGSALNVCPQWTLDKIGSRPC